MKGWGVVLLLLGKTSLAAAPSGLLDQPQTFPWSVGLTPVVQEEAGGLETGSYRLRSSVLWFNTYRQFGAGDETTQVVDMEGVLATLSAAWAPAPGWEFRGQVQGWSLGGGVMDPWLSWFHTAGGLPNQGRESAPLDGYRDFLAGSFDDRTPSSGLSQASVALRRWQGPWSWTSWIKLPVPSHVGWGGVPAGGADWASAGATGGGGLKPDLPWEPAFRAPLCWPNRNRRFPAWTAQPQVKGGFTPPPSGQADLASWYREPGHGCRTRA